MAPEQTPPSVLEDPGVPEVREVLGHPRPDPALPWAPVCPWAPQDPGLPGHPLTPSPPCPPEPPYTHCLPSCPPVPKFPEKQYKLNSILSFLSQYCKGSSKKMCLLFENSRSSAASTVPCRCTAYRPFTKRSSSVLHTYYLTSFLLLNPVVHTEFCGPRLRDCIFRDSHRTS